MSRWFRRGVWFVLIALMAVFIRVESNVREGYARLPELDRATILPDASLAPILAMGFHHAWAELFLLEAQMSITEQRLAGQYETGKRLRALFDLIHALDPHYADGTVFGAMALAEYWGNMGVADGNELLLRGMHHNPDDYRFPLTLGFHYYLHGGDYPENRRQAARWFRVCLSYDECPQSTVWMAERLMQGSDSALEMQASMLCSMCQTSDEEVQRKHLCQRCAYYSLLLELEPVCRAFKQHRGRPIATPQELVPDYLPALPDDPMGGIWQLSESGCLVSSEMFEDTATVSGD